MALSSIYDAVALQQHEATSVSLEGGSSGNSTSASVSIRVEGDKTEVGATVHVQGEGGSETVSTVATKTTGEETATSIDMDVQSSGQDVYSSTAVATAVNGEGETDVQAATVFANNDDLVISSEGEAAANGEDPSASVLIVNSADMANDSSVLSGNSQAEASVRAEEGDDAAASTAVNVGPGFEITSEQSSAAETVVDGTLNVESSASVEAEEVDVVELGSSHTVFIEPFFGGVWWLGEM